jgi:site-specific DNA-methyltransferase (adenine-specific)
VTINLYNTDCMQALRDMPDNMYDLAIVDPPYGISIVSQMKKGRGFYKTAVGSEKLQTEWDSDIPSAEYFEHLQRVSKYQVIWGGNYFLDHLGQTRCMLIWDKHNGTNPLADAEIAWTNLDRPVRKFTMHHFSSGYGTKIHPTQKPVRLYEWILQTFAKPTDRILDTHLGSGSIAVACHNTGHSLDAYEIDAEYFAAAQARLHEHQRQLRLFV